MAKKKKGLQLSSKLKFKKPSKKLSYLDSSHLLFKSTTPRFGSYAIQSTQEGVMTKNQIEALRIAIRRPIKSYRAAKVWVLLKPDRILTKRSAETRMGKGKGSPVQQVVLIHGGQTLFEVSGPPVQIMKSIFEKARKKFPMPVALLSLSR